MNNKKIIKNNFAIPMISSEVKSLNNTSEIKETSLNNKEYTSPTSIWRNSIYSFNKNYVKNIPSVDNIVNKMIKSFFTINALDNNIDNKKSRLIQRRYKRLSLNKIFVSKSDIKHSNNKVTITVYLFNKKRNTILLNLSKMYNTLSLGFSKLNYKNISWRKKNNFEILASKFLDSTYTRDNQSSFEPNSKSNLKSETKIVNYTNLSENIYNTDKNYKLKNLNTNNYAFMPIINKINILNNGVNFKSNSLYKEKNITTGQDMEFKNKILYYNRLNNLTKYNIHKFINSLALISSNSNTVDYKLLTLAFKFFVYTNQYKLYNSIENLYNKNSELSTVLNNRPKTTTKFNSILPLNKLNYTIYKLRSLHKLFALYNNYANMNKSNLPLFYYNKILLNVYKLLKKSNTQISRFGDIEKISNSLIPVTSKSNKKNDYTNTYSLPKGKYAGTTKNTSMSKVYYKKSQQNAIILVKKLNRIDRFFKRYENVFLKSNTKSLLNTKNNSKSDLSSQVISNYKINFINDLLEKELIYINYLKQLSYNNAVFKNWFLFPLKTLLAKIYNKKVNLNLVNLKYMHLNSDILTQAVDIRLRNFRKNKLVEVLRRAVKLVSVSKVNIYACDEHSSMYKYIHDYYNKYRNLKLDIFKELNVLDTDLNKKSNLELDLNKDRKGMTFTPCIIRRLNHIQTSTINFIKFKSVFGVRLEAAGRLTKRSTASRALFKFRYKGTLKNNSTINNMSATIIKNHQISNLQLTKISSKTRNGSFGLKGWINSN